MSSRGRLSPRGSEVDARLIKLTEVMQPTVALTNELKDGFCKQAVIMKLQEAVFWFEKGVQDEQNNTAKTTEPTGSNANVPTAE